MRCDKIRCCAVGDSFLIEKPAHGNVKIAELKELISTNDVAVTNVESTLHRFERDVYPARESGGDWAASSPEVVEELKWLGFNLLSAPNNHSMDYLHTGLLRTIESFEKADVVFAGIGANLAEAEAPRYISTPNGRVALIALNLSFENWHTAGEQRRDLNGRPGINYVSHQKIYGVCSETYEALRAIAREYPTLSSERSGMIKVGDNFFEQGPVNIRTRADDADVARLGRNIARARRQADVVMVSVHSHEDKNGDADRPAEFEEQLARTIIDCGADAYIGHGPHVVRGIEIYKNRPIMYSLGNFFYQCELIERSPAEFYRKFAEFDEHACTADVFDYRVNNGGALGETNREYYRSILVVFSFAKDGKLDALTVHPLDLNFSAHRAAKGTPELAHGKLTEEIFEDLTQKSRAYGVCFVRRGDALELSMQR